MRYFFVSPDRVSEDSLVIERVDCHHIRDVLRMKTGDILDVSDGCRYAYRAKILDYSNEEVFCSIVEQVPLPPVPSPKITLLQSIPKGKRMDWLVQKAAEIGVHEILPMTMARSVRFLQSDKTEHRTGRWRRIAEAAAKQSGRFELPRVEEPLTLSSALDRVKAVPLRIFLEPHGRGTSLRRVSEDHSETDRVALLVGPEGGITDEERELLQREGFISVSLWDLIFRTETAGILATALVRYEWSVMTTQA